MQDVTRMTRQAVIEHLKDNGIIIPDNASVIVMDDHGVWVIHVEFAFDFELWTKIQWQIAAQPYWSHQLEVSNGRISGDINEYYKALAADGQAGIMSATQRLAYVRYCNEHGVVTYDLYRVRTGR